jgi:hypothetical protein
MKSKKFLVLLLVVAVSLCLAGCGAGKKTAATTAIKAAEDAYTTVKDDLVKYVPEEAKKVEDAIADAKESLTKKKFDEAIAKVKEIPAKVTDLTAMAKAKKDETIMSWAAMSKATPEMLEAIKGKLGALSKVKKLPAGLDKTKLDTCKGDYEAAVKMWDEAKAASDAGNVADAVTKGKAVEEKAMGIMTTLGMKVPAPPAQS